MRVIILGKAPVAGRVKTRLMPEYSAEDAAKLHMQMMETVLSKVCSMFTDVWVAVDDVNHERIQSLSTDFSVTLLGQGSGNLGDRLGRLMALSFARDTKPVLFLGTDSPHVSLQRYQEVVKNIVSHDVVIGPVEDGGYDLIALKANVPELFEGITWGTETVFKETLNKINKLELSVKVLSSSFDLDRAEDLRRAPPQTW